MSRIYTRVRLSGESVDIPPPRIGQGDHNPASRTEAADELERVRQQAYEEGRREGQQQVRLQTMNAMDQLGALSRALGENREKMVRDAEADIARLVTEAARLIVQRELRTDPAAVVDLVRPLVARVADRGNLRMRLNPQDAALVRASSSGTAHACPEIEEDATLERGDCVLESDSGALDGRLDVRLQQVLERFGS